jgi:hypothetical protein
MLLSNTVLVGTVRLIIDCRTVLVGTVLVITELNTAEVGTCNAVAPPENTPDVGTVRDTVD